MKNDFDNEKNDDPPTSSHQLAVTADPPPLEIMWDSEAAQNNLVAEVNRLYQVGGLETALKIGNYLIETIFGGDGQRVVNRKQHPNSFRALAHRQDLQMKFAFLYYSVAVCEQIRALPAEVAARLPLSCSTTIRNQH